MAQYRATIKGQRGLMSRLGSKKSGIQAAIDGWNVGVRVEIDFDYDLGVDVVSVYVSGGSNAGISPILIKQYYRDLHGQIIYIPV